MQANLGVMGMGSIWTKRRAKSYQREQPTAADLGPPEQQVRVVVEEIALTPTVTTKRARRCDPLDAIHLHVSHKCAALIYRQAWEHVEAGRGMGPLPWGRDMMGSGGERMPAQMRALTAAVMYRRGWDAGGSAPVVSWVVLWGRSLATYDAGKQHREGLGKMELEAALERMAGEYGV